jgi:hypothetical protein
MVCDAISITSSARIHRVAHHVQRIAHRRATLRDLMDRMGHATTRAALIYLHKSAGRDKAIADAGKMLEDRQQTEDGDQDPDEGTAGVRVPA